MGLFGADYFGFSEKPDPTVRKKIAVYLKVIFIWVTGFCLLVFLFFSMSAQSNAKDNARVTALFTANDLTDVQWKNTVILVDRTSVKRKL